MTLDFDRYLSYTDPDPGSLDQQIQKAYREWGSFCYLAYDRCGGMGRGVQGRTESGQQQAEQESQHGSLPVQQYILNNNNNYTSNLERSSEHYEYGYNSDLYYYGYGTSASVPLNIDDNMPRPPGQSFGSRLAWIGSAKSQSLPACPDGPLMRRRKSPALGVSGLKCGNNTNTIMPRSDERLPKRAVTTKFARTSLSVSVTSCQRSNGIVEYSNVNSQHLTERTQSWDLENNVLEARTKSVSANVSSVALAPVCDDVIEEVGSEEETISSEEEIPDPPRSRRISFADEHGETLVQCRLYERDSDDFGSEESLEEEEEEEEDDDGGMSDTEDSIKPKRFTVLADEAYRTVCNDIQNVKRLLRQNREFFRSLAPQDEGDVNGNKSLSPFSSDEEIDECVVFPSRSTRMGHSSCSHLGNPDCARNSKSDESPTINIPTKSTEDDHCQGNGVPNGLSNQEKTVIAQTEAHINEQIKEICELLIDDHTSDCVETDLKAIRIAKPTVECKFTNFSVPHQHKSSDLVLHSLDHVTGARAIEGTITVSGVCRGKDIFVRWSTDRWSSFSDIQAEIVDRKSMKLENKDLYVFTLPVPVSTLSSESRTLEFAIFCEDVAAGCRHWNNNAHQNFVVEIFSNETF